MESNHNNQCTMNIKIGIMHYEYQKRGPCITERKTHHFVHFIENIRFICHYIRFLKYF